MTRFTSFRFYQIIGCFMQCKKLELEHAVLSKSITLIPKQTFESCAKLKEISIPEGITKIDNNAFYGCTALEAATLPDTLETIEYSAFSIDTKIKNITIPKSVKNIGEHAFNKWKEDQTITFEGRFSVPKDWGEYWSKACKAKIEFKP